MGGLIDVRYTWTTASAIEVEAVFRAPPKQLIEAAQWALANRVTFFYTNGTKVESMNVLDVQVEYDYVDATTFGGTPTYLSGAHSMTVRGYLRP